MLNIGRGKIPTQNEGKDTGNKGNHREKISENRNAWEQKLRGGKDGKGTDSLVKTKKHRLGTGKMREKQDRSSVTRAKQEKQREVFTGNGKLHNIKKRF